MDARQFPRTLTLDPEDCASVYQSFIQELRSFVKSPGRLTQDIPLLPAQSANANYVDVELWTESHVNGIKMRMKEDNLYIVGFQNLKSHTWYNFQDTTVGIPSSTALSFKGTYYGYVERAASVLDGREHVPLGFHPLSHPVHTMANIGTSRRDQQARAILVVAQMISESLRFTTISGKLVAKFVSGITESDELREIVHLENRWSELSTVLLEDDSRSSGSATRTRTVVEGLVEEAKSNLALVLNVKLATPRAQARSQTNSRAR